MARTSLLQWKAPRLYKDSTSSKGTFTVDTANNFIVDASHGMTVGDLVEFTTTDTLPAPLAINTIYSVFEDVSTSNFTITLDGFTELDITDTGVGTHSYEYYNVNVTLENFVVTEDAPQNRVFWHESIINNHREIVNGDKMHWLLGFQMNLFKEATLTTRRTDFDELFGYLYTDVYVSRVNDNGAAAVVIKDSAGAPVFFVMDRFETSFVAQSKFEDRLDVGLKSKDVIDMSATV